jgi:flagellar biosynthesis/type III secretory pathway M-ring protein FliF/YscJ
MILQVPTPPTPPGPQFDPNLFFMQHGGPPAVVLIVAAALTAAVIILWPLMRAFARRVEGKGTGDTTLRGEVEQLQAKLGEVQERIAELEERLDFTERLLAQSHDVQSRVLPGETR